MTGSILLSFTFASGSGTAWHGTEHYTIPVPQDAPALETPGTPCLRSMCSGSLVSSALLSVHLFLSGFLHLATCQVPPLCLPFPGPQYILPALFLCTSTIHPGPTLIPLLYRAFLTTLTPSLPFTRSSDFALL